MPPGQALPVVRMGPMWAIPPAISDRPRSHKITPRHACEDLLPYFFCATFTGPKETFQTLLLNDGLRHGLLVTSNEQRT